MKKILLGRYTYIYFQTVKHSEVKINATTRRSWHHSDSLSTVQILVLTDETKKSCKPCQIYFSENNRRYSIELW